MKTESSKQALTTYVTALRFINLTLEETSINVNYLFAGIGNQVHIYSTNVEHPVAIQAILPAGVRIHGILQGTNNKIAIHGSRTVAIMHVTTSQTSAPSMSVLCQREFPDWIWGAKWICGSTILAIAGGHSKVWICNDGLDCYAHVESEEKEMTWCSSLFLSKDRRRLRALNGTSFGHILISNTLTTKHETHTLDKPLQISDLDLTIGKERNCSNVHRLKGHDGPIMRVSINADGNSMVTASVDRSVRVWKTKSDKNCNICLNDGCFEIMFVHYGHLARVWDVCFMSWKDMCVASVAEDGTCRIWSGKKEGETICVYHEHAGRNIWSIDVNSDIDTICLATGGEDGSVRIRNLSTRMVEEPKEDGGVLENDCVMGHFELPGRFANPRKMDCAYNESARCIVIPEHLVVLLTTDFGRVLCARVRIIDEKVSVKWIELYRNESGTAYTPMSLVCCNGLIMCGQTNGKVTILKVNNDTYNTSHMYTICAFEERNDMVTAMFSHEEDDKNVTLLVCTPLGEAYHWHINTTSVPLYVGKYQPSKLSKTTLITSMFATHTHITLGDRHGRLCHYLKHDIHSPNSSPIHHPVCVLRAHTDRISSIIDAKSPMFIHVASFDGRISTVSKSSSEELIVSRVSRATHNVRTLTQIGRVGDGVQTVGFRGACMVVLDGRDGTQREGLRLSVGNWRRAHAVRDGLVAYWRGREMHIAEMRDDGRCWGGWHGGRGNGVAWCGDGGVLTVGEDCHVLHCKSEGGGWSVLQRMREHVSGVACVDVRGGVAMTGGGGDEVLMWRFERGWRVVGRISVQGGGGRVARHRVMAVNVVREMGREVVGVVGRSDGSVRLVGLEGDVWWIGDARMVGGCVLCVAERDGVVTTGASDGYVATWRVVDRRLVAVGKWKAHEGGVNDVVMLRQCVITGGDDGGMTMSQNGKISRILFSHAAVGGVTCVIGRGDLFVSGGNDERVRVWQVEGGVMNTLKVVTCEIADVGGVCAKWEADTFCVTTIVCGVGMQKLQIYIGNDQ